jgi:prepilin signal peptidase PulO-like enzyme (type II secretory pathway)
MIYVILVIVGLALGSFVNAFVWRWRKKKDWVKGQSECVHCHHKLAVCDLIPVLSWVWLKGKCRYCRKPISVQYPLVELITAVLFVLRYIFWPVSITGAIVAIFVLWLMLLTGLIALAVYDLRWQLLPDKIVLSLGVIAVAQAIVRIAAGPKPFTILLNTILGVLVGGGIFYILFQISKGKWIGGGDVKLGFLLGMIVATPGRAFLLLFLASLLGTLMSLPLLADGHLKRSSRIPFGPFLILAAVIVVLFGHDIIHWYQTTFVPYTT